MVSNEITQYAYKIVALIPWYSVGVDQCWLDSCLKEPPCVVRMAAIGVWLINYANSIRGCQLITVGAYDLLHELAMLHFVVCIWSTAHMHQQHHKQCRNSSNLSHSMHEANWDWYLLTLPVSTRCPWWILQFGLNIGGIATQLLVPDLPVHPSTTPHSEFGQIISRTTCHWSAAFQRLATTVCNMWHAGKAKWDLWMIYDADLGTKTAHLWKTHKLLYSY